MSHPHSALLPPCVGPARSPLCRAPAVVHRTGFLTGLIGLLLTPFLAHASSEAGVGTNLLVNPGFENGMTGWTVIQPPNSSNAAVVTYGSTDVASLVVSNRIGGGNRLLRDLGSATAVEQTVQVGMVPPGTNLFASGYFGGLANLRDDARLVLLFLDNTGGLIAQRSLDPVTYHNRNFETVLMVREGIFAIPTNTDAITARIEFQNLQCCQSSATADSICLSLTTSALIPPPQPLDVELLVNPGFENGWSSSSPLTLVNSQGWEGLTGGSRTRDYADSNTETPSVATSVVVAGDTRLLADGGGGGASLRQRLDIRGNSGQIATGSLALRVSAFLGGVTAFRDNARVEVHFLRGDFTQTGPAISDVGPVTVENRNAETVVMIRKCEYDIPLNAEYIDVEVHFADLQCCLDLGLLDNVSVQLGAPTPVTPLPLNVNIVHNGSFEDGSLPGSPLVLTDPGSWLGTTSETVELLVYGATLEAPDTGFAAMNQLGGVLVSDVSSNGILRKEFSLAGHNVSIDAGQLILDASVWLGGFSTNPDEAQLSITFLDAGHIQIGGQQILGPVSEADRGGMTTLIEQSASMLIPSGSEFLRLEATFLDLQCCSGNGLLDGVRVVLRNQGQLGQNYCTASPNSSGSAAWIFATGSSSIANNDLVLNASGVPSGVNGIFFYGPNQASIPLGDGALCITGAIQRLAVVTSDGSGLLMHAVDYSALSGSPNVISPGSTWDFQAWFRDVPAGGAGSNLSDGLELTFLP